MVPVCDKRYHIYNRFRHFWAEIKKLWNYQLILCNAMQSNKIKNKNNVQGNNKTDF